MISMQAAFVREPFFDATTQAWIVTDPGQARELAASARLRPVTYSAHYRALEKRFNLDFSSLVFAFDHSMPLAQYGERHWRVLRRAMGELLGGARSFPAVAALIRPAVARHFACLGRPGEDRADAETPSSPSCSEIMATVADVPADSRCRPGLGHLRQIDGHGQTPSARGGIDRHARRDRRTAMGRTSRDDSA